MAIILRDQWFYLLTLLASVTSYKTACVVNLQSALIHQALKRSFVIQFKKNISDKQYRNVFFSNFFCAAYSLVLLLYSFFVSLSQCE
jgi:hypothetical protein